MGDGFCLQSLLKTKSCSRAVPPFLTSPSMGFSALGKGLCLPAETLQKGA